MSKLTGVCNNHFLSKVHPDKSLILYVCEFSMMEFNYAVDFYSECRSPICCL